MGKARQAIQLDSYPDYALYRPHLKDQDKSISGIANWLLMRTAVGLTIGFGKSDNLAAAYGIALSATLLATSAQLFIQIWYWDVLRAGIITGLY
ncbi:KUP/HAK/KT family potassium transporter [Legionella cherrii]|uniref:KUP/HAK/KT family potassium transporter n=1 Tax=Legionella cherrii TaxID=28084 RepID=UPI0012E3BA4A